MKVKRGKLFRRTHRGIELTPRGTALLNATSNAFNIIASATALAMAPTRAAPVRLNLAPTFAMRWLVPRLSQFYARYPNVLLEMSTSQRPCGADLADFDATIDYCGGHWPNMHAERLFDSIVIPVCSPHLTNGTAPPRTDRDIAGHTLLHSINRPYLWPNWLAAAGIDGVEPCEGPRFQNSSLVYQAAADGLGIAIGEVSFLIDDINQGKLVAPFAPQRDTEGSYYLIYPRADAAKPGLAAFRHWLMEEAAATAHRVRECWPSVAPPAEAATPPPLRVVHRRPA